MSIPQATKRLKQQIGDLLEAQRDDLRLRDILEGLRHDTALPGLTWFWGPALYRRNRVVFRPFILNHFSEWEQGGGAWKRIAWRDHAAELEEWLAAARKNRDVLLVRRLLRWKFAGRGWGIDHKGWRAALLAAYEEARGPAARAVVLDEFDEWFELDEATALRLFAIDRAAKGFLLRHLSHSFRFWGDEKRQLWSRLAAAAEATGDEELRWSLYRRQVPVKQWQADVLALAEEVSDTDRLNDALHRRHPEGYGLKLGPAIVKLLERRGRDVMPYVRSKLTDLVGGWEPAAARPFVQIAAGKGWWDLWAAAIRASSREELFNRAVASLLDDGSIAESQRLERLRALAGVSREWNWAGFGLARIHWLKDDLAARLYRRYPQVIHGPMKPNVTPTWWQGYPQLLAAAQAAGDEELIDLLASRYANQIGYESTYWRAKEHNQIMATADALGDDYQRLRDRDPLVFAQRAANVLTRIPAYAIRGYGQLLRTNKLARLLFVRSMDALLSVPEAVRDLVEGSDIHVQMLAYRVLAQDDDRARCLAVENIEILLGTLLRPLHRKTRLAALGALANAARADAEAGRRVLARARDALRLPDLKYPKEELVGLIGLVLHHRPELRRPREQPVVYGREGGSP